MRDKWKRNRQRQRMDISGWGERPRSEWLLQPRPQPFRDHLSTTKPVTRRIKMPQRKHLIINGG